MCGFALDQTIPRDDKASGSERAAYEGYADSRLRFPGRAGFAVQTDRVEDAFRRLRPFAVEGCIAAERLPSTVIDADESDSTIEP